MKEVIGILVENPRTIENSVAGVPARIIGL
jgi:hypothetical protein